jgi:hypothetical protein
MREVFGVPFSTLYCKIHAINEMPIFVKKQKNSSAARLINHSLISLGNSYRREITAKK